MDIDAVGQEVAARVTERLSGFEERMNGLEADLRQEVGRVRSTAQVIDLLADEVRRALHEETPHHDAVTRRLTSLEQTVAGVVESLHAIDPEDLAPVKAGLADLLEAEAARSERERRDSRSADDAIAQLRIRWPRSRGPSRSTSTR